MVFTFSKFAILTLMSLILKANEQMCCWPVTINIQTIRRRNKPYYIYFTTTMAYLENETRFIFVVPPITYFIKLYRITLKCFADSAENLRKKNISDCRLWHFWISSVVFAPAAN